MAKPPARPKKRSKAWEDRMLISVGAYLESKGWSVAVLNADRIQGPVDLGSNYEFVIRFTGGKKRSAEEKKPATVALPLHHASKPGKKRVTSKKLTPYSVPLVTNS